MNLFSTAAAEEAAADTVAKGGLQIFEILFILIGAYELVSGLMTIMKKKIFGSNASAYAKYTDDSVEKATPLIGLTNALCGLFLILMGLKDAKLINVSTPVELVFIGVFLAGIIALTIYVYKKVLIKKTENTGNQQNQV